jgi:hypothetical protein
MRSVLSRAVASSLYLLALPRAALAQSDEDVACGACGCGVILTMGVVAVAAVVGLVVFLIMRSKNK